MKYSPPVNRDVTSADVKYAIERSLLPGVPNGYVQTYLKDVVGIQDAIKEAQKNPTGGAPDIKGITTPDDQTLEIQLTKTSSAGVIGALTLPVSSPVPEEYAKKYDAKNPSTYGENQVATGPYMIKHVHAEQGDRPRSQPELELGRRLPSGVPGRDQGPGGLRRHGLRVEEDPHRSAAWSTATSQRRRRRSSRPFRAASRDS